VIRYGKNLLAADVRAKLDEMFEHMQVKEVTEVKIADFATKAYVIVLEDKKSLKTVQVIEDDISVLSEIEK
jgi:adenine C2-methylase RlmN of 23S rRNA A2503 and tRNA A37